MSLNSEQILAALSEVTDPGTKKKLALTAKNCEIKLNGTDVDVTVPLGYPSHNGQAELQKRIETALAALGLKLGSLRVNTQIASHRSEEHTSELQSLMRISYAVFSLNKKTNKNSTS